ncbi:MAG: membrane dipeptidase [Gammaproteobacteria bacterium]|nr:membrane dipeptidase [Gammaproteobacteria bacterium]
MVGALVAYAALVGCANRDAALTADDVLRDAVLIDTHIDTPFRIERHGLRDTRVRPAPRIRCRTRTRGQLATAFMSIFVPASVDEAGDGIALADRLIDHVEALAESSQGRAGLVSCVADVYALKTAGRVGLALGMENGGPLAADAAAVEHFADRGVRYVTLAHGKANAFSDSSYDATRPWGGLSPAGVAMVGRLNALGIMVDVSHLSDDAFWDVLEASALPVIASHSSVRALTPGFERNLSDDMIRALAAKAGVVQINFGSSFISAAARAWQSRFEEVFVRYLADARVTFDSAAARTFRTQYLAAHPYPRADLAVVLDHIDHVVSLVGSRHVGLGSDFDGVGDTLPTGIGDVSMYPNLVQGLIERGYDRRAIKQILGENLLRVWQANEDFAEQQGRTTQCRT